MILRFINFYQQFIQGFSQIAAPLMSMLRIAIILIANKSIFVEDNVNGISSSKMILEANNKKSEAGFLISGARLAFAEFK